MERPQTRYVEVGRVEVAYQIVGQGPPDLIHIPGFDHVDVRSMSWTVGPGSGDNATPAVT
jgi:hypothetical protein